MAKLQKRSPASHLRSPPSQTQPTALTETSTSDTPPAFDTSSVNNNIIAIDAASQPSSLLAGVKAKICPLIEPTKIEDWSRPQPQQMEALLPADSAAAENLENAKVLNLLGVTSVVKFDMVTAEKKQFVLAR